MTDKQSDGPMRGVIDSCVYHNFRVETDVVDYLSAGWKEYLGYGQKGPRNTSNHASITPKSRTPNPLGDTLAEATPASGGPAGSELALTKMQHLDSNGIDRAVLSHHLALGMAGIPNSRLGVELIRACNDFSLEQWAARDDRLYYAAMVPTQVPEAAAAEIARLARNPKVVAAMFGVNGLSKPFGHQIYHPIYAAASEAGLPVILYAGADIPVDVDTHPTAGGLPSTFSDLYVNVSLSTVTHLMNVVGQGVLDQYPDLKVMAIGAGVGFLIPVMWRAEEGYRERRRSVPWAGAYTPLTLPPVFSV